MNRWPRRFVVFPILLGLVSCAAPGWDVPSRIPPQDVDLAAKAESIESATFTRVNNLGLLLYRWREPFSDLDHFRRSHALADGAAWQGYLIAALAFKAAALQSEGALTSEMKVDIGGKLERLAGFYEHCFAVNEQPGLICRAALDGYDGAEPLPFMQREHSGYAWVRSAAPPFRWWLNRPNKDHVNMAGAGLGIALGLDATERMLTPGARAALLRVLVPMAKRLVRDEYSVLDADGEPTRHPDMGPSSFGLPNGFNRIMTLQLLAAAARHGTDPALREEYERRLSDWGTGYARWMHRVGWWTRFVTGHATRDLNPGHSNPQALAMAACGLLLNEQRPVYADEVKATLAGWWRFMRFEGNGVYSPVFSRWVANAAEVPEIMAPVFEHLQAFPEPKVLTADELTVTRRLVQPLVNREVDTNYWKANPYEKVLARGEDSGRRAAGMDYLLTYWMSRYFGFRELP